jgi:SAM-dependent methyltransferase
MSSEPIDVPSAIGASLLIRRDVLHEVGGLDPAFFTYGEEMDLCRRARERGFAVALVPASRVRHVGEGSSRTRLLRWRNRWLRTRNDGLLFLKRPRVRILVSAAELPARVARLAREDLRAGEPMTALLRLVSLPRGLAAIPRTRRARAREDEPWAHLGRPDAAGAGERDRDAMSGVTRFFRNPIQLDVLLGEIARDPASRGRTLRVAVHACSTGAEPYTLAIEAARRSIPLVIEAFDRDPRYVASARRGMYRRADVDAAAAGGDLASYFESAGEGALRVAATLRRAMRFALADIRSDADVDREGLYDVVLCQNVLIHFDTAAQLDVAKRLARAVRPGGWLVVAGRSPEVAPVLREIGFIPIVDRCREIHEAWTERRRPFDEAVARGVDPPYWALGPFDPGAEDAAFRFGTIFRRPS